MFNLSNGFFNYELYYYVGILFSMLYFFLMIIRGFLFYKKGITYAEENNISLPKLTESQYVIFAAGVLIPLFLSCIPFINYLNFIFVCLVFISVISKILQYKNIQKIKPEAMALLGVGLGISGTIGFILGFHRAMSDQKEENIEL